MASVALTDSLIVNFVLWGVMGNTTEFSSGNDSPATGNSILLVDTELCDLLTNLIFAVGAILAQTLRFVSQFAIYIRAFILLRPPVAITEMVSIMYLHIFDLRELGAQVLPLRPRLNLNNPEAEEATDQHLLHCDLSKLFLDK